MLHDLQTQIDQAQAKLTGDRESFEAQRKRFADEQEQAKKLAADQGFQNALGLYSGMPAKQAKALFLTLGDDVVKSYLEAMDQGAATKIIKEFKTPDELDRIHRILEKIRQADSASGVSGPATQPSKD
jgi:FPC/CPF motif-containing protein YcgG